VAVSPEDAHEINNLLVYVILGLELIEREALAECDHERIRVLVKDALEGAEKVRALVRDLRSPPPVARVDAARPRVLLIDDDARLGQTLAIGLRDRAEIVPARTGADALRLLAAEPGFDLILCDLDLPDLSGIDVFQQVAPALQPKFVFTTGGALDDRSREFLRTVARLDKPFRLEELETLLFTGRSRPSQG